MNVVYQHEKHYEISDVLFLDNERTESTNERRPSKMNSFLSNQSQCLRKILISPFRISCVEQITQKEKTIYPPEQRLLLQHI